MWFTEAAKIELRDLEKSISCHYANTDCHYIDPTGTYHEDVAEDIMNFASKKFGLQTSAKDFSAIWRYRARLVSGEDNPDGI